MKNKLKAQNDLDDKDTTPWYEASENYINEKVKKYKLNVSIGVIVNKVKTILLASQGDIISADVVRNLNIEGLFNFAKTTDKKESSKTSTDIDGVKVYILFDYIQKISDSKSTIKKVFGFSKRKFKLKVIIIYLSLKIKPQ